MAKPMEYNYVLKYRIGARLKEPLHVGSAMGEKNEVLIHPVTGIPFIQASSIAGAMRAYCDESTHNLTEYIFGLQKMSETENSGSRIKVSDGILGNDERIKMEFRPRVKISGKTGTVSSSKITSTDNDAGHKFEMLLVGKNQKLMFECFLFLTADKLDKVKDAMMHIFSAINSEVIQLGGQKSNGCGYMEIDSLKLLEYDLAKPEGLSRWLDESEEGQKDIKEQLWDESKREYVFIVEGETEGELQVRGISSSEFGKNAPASISMRNSENEYIVPGSSIKGVIRNQMKKIAGYLGLDAETVIEDTFGSQGKGSVSGKAGNIRFMDMVVGDYKENDMMPLRDHIHIDKFTGGVMNGGKFNEKNICGKFCFKVVIKDRDDAGRTAGLLTLALRDIAMGTVSLGNGSSIGKGFLDIKKISVSYSGRQAEICPENGSVKDESGMINQWLREIKEGR